MDISQNSVTGENTEPHPTEINILNILAQLAGIRHNLLWFYNQILKLYPQKAE
jgi:hypothetical protein